MSPDRTILAFDTSAAHCAVALFQAGRSMSARADLMKKGQAEHLFPMLEDLLDENGLTWPELDAIGVGVGPGNFTGIRVAVSAARGIALARGIPAIGITSFDVATAGRTAPAWVPAHRGHAYLRFPDAAPNIVPIDQAEAVDDALTLPSDPAAIALEIARQANQRLVKGSVTVQTRPAPLYIKPADAAPASDPPPVILP